MRATMVIGCVTFLSACALESDAEPQTQPLDCGSIQTMTAWTTDFSITCADDAETNAALDCFDAAWTACEPARVVASWSGIDSTITQTYEIRSTQTGCFIKVRIEDSIAAPPQRSDATCTVNPFAAGACTSLQMCTSS